MASTFVLDPATHITACVPRMTKTAARKPYQDKQYPGGLDEWKKAIEKTATVYVGNLSCYTNEYQLHELFSRCGSIKRIIMGLDKIKKTPCGFCFVEFDERESALKSLDYLNRIHLDGRVIQVDLDAGFRESRQYGRGKEGGQAGDERRQLHEQRVAQWNSFGNSLTRSITIVACLSILTMICISTQVDSAPEKPVTLYHSRHGHSTQYLNPLAIRKAQIGESRAEFEKSFAAFLVNIMKAAKPSLLKAFISATLADKQLKDIAIAMFFNNTETDSDTH